MFFDSASDIKKIMQKCQAAVFVMPDEAEIKIKNAILVQPEEKAVITIEQIKNLIQKLNVKQTSDQYVVIRPADLMTDEAANAFLKRLEEPGEKVHFVLVTDSPSKLLPTVLSRSAVYFLRDSGGVSADIKASETVKKLAKKLLVAKGGELVAVAEEIGKKKDGVRGFALEVIGAAIEMLYKTYFITKKEVFLTKLPRFLDCYERIAKNGHVKLQIVASLC